MSTSAIIVPPALELIFNRETIDSCILPHIILWDPLNQWPRSFKEGMLCPYCSQLLAKIIYWKWGQSDGLQPRVIHGIESTVLIVPAVYTCIHEHTVVATDPRILKELVFEQLPFILLHRTGFTKAFITSIIQLMRGGMTIVQVENYITSCRREFIASLYVRLQLLLPESSSGSLTLNSVPFQLLKSPYPSNNVICQCFIAHFKEYEHTYNLQMQQLTADNCITLDHTFKIASNIGFQRSDKKWVTQYNSVLFIMNEIGQVIAWQLTKTTSLDETKLLFNNLATRLTKDRSNLLIFVDNCCTLRDKLIGMMGSNIVVKLDLFHAVQRITKTISKRHPFFHRCMADLKLVFRDPNDLGQIRQLHTPKSEIIEKNLDEFVEKWESCVHEEQPIITESTRKEVTALKKHIRKGCLSDISKGAGTSRNEAFHRTLNMHFGRVSRIGIPLALALLTVLIYQQVDCKVLYTTYDRQTFFLYGGVGFFEK